MFYDFTEGVPQGGPLSPLLANIFLNEADHQFETNRSNGKSSTWVKLKLRQIGQGWIQYFKLADMKSLLKRIDEWVRRRIRMSVWKTWKRVRTRYKYLQKLGINKYKAWQWANTRKSYWRVAGSFILTRTLTNERIAKQGYISLLDYYKLVKI